MNTVYQKYEHKYNSLKEAIQGSDQNSSKMYHLGNANRMKPTSHKEAPKPSSTDRLKTQALLSYIDLTQKLPTDYSPRWSTKETKERNHSQTEW